MRFVNTPNCKDDENMYPIQYNYQIYYVTTEAIPAGSELFIWYGSAYAATLGLNSLECNSYLND